ncbi:membrane protein [Paraoerskovia sediminicola]|uniref:Membrane protein n=1 Tax=Paraoerskovia sediminicola TaxID=1138587 RepID=A0ABM8G0P3_9CELL|nr:threonine/serine exporter family protein [Paraoerskovia sediminicola]BDZ41479.1 membrane protein [Paraoerskovia sediminicola]
MPTQPDDDEIELIRRSGVALRAGRLSLSAGTGSYRVKASMSRVARAVGIDRHTAHVTLTEITATSHQGPSFRTEVTEVRTVGVNTDRLNELERLAQRLEERGHASTVDEVAHELDRIQNKPPLYPVALNALWAAMACAGFAFLNNGGWLEVVGVFFGAGFGQALRRVLIHRGWNQFGVTMYAATLACLTYVVFLLAAQGLGADAASHEAGYTSAVLFLIPGFPLVTGALDLAKLDFSAGVARLTYALMILTSAALAVWAVSGVAGLDPVPSDPLPLSTGVLWGLRILASFVAALGFALMFNSPWRMALAAGWIGAVANAVRLALVDGHLPVQAAAAIAALLVGLITAYVAPRLNFPRITTSVPAVVIMIPGSAAYRAIFHLSNGETTEALAYGVEAGLVIAALAIGLAFARMLTDKEWAFER